MTNSTPAVVDASSTVASPLTQAQARKLTDRIAKGSEQLWSLLREAHEKNAWARLGYATWEAYVAAEFGMSRGQSYRLINQAEVITQLQLAAGTTTVGVGDVSARAAEAIKPALDDVADKVAKATAGKPEEAKPAIVRDIVNETRAQTAPPTPRIPESTVPSVPRTATVDRSLEAAALIRQLVALKPVDVRSLDESLVTKMMTWGRDVRTARNAKPAAAKTSKSTAKASKAAAKSTSKSTKATAKAGVAKCTHPIGRRIGDACGVCGEKVS